MRNDFAHCLNPRFATLILSVSIALSSQAQTTHEVTLTLDQAQELVANAGLDILTPKEILQVGAVPIASGGTPPYLVSWSPESFLSDTHAPNPVLTIDEDIDLTYTLSVTDSKGCTAQDDVHVRLIVTGLHTKEDGVSIFPNPTSSILTIESDSQIANIQLINSAGAMVYSSAMPGKKHDIPLENLSQGIYVLQYELHGVKFSQRVNVNR